MNRRQFLSRAGTLAAAIAARNAPSAAAESVSQPALPLVGSQLYGWGQYYERDKKDFSARIGEVLSAIRDCGCDYAEGSMDVWQVENNARFAEQLKQKGLKPVSLYTGGTLHDRTTADKTVASIITAAKVCRDSGFQTVNCNPDPIGRAKTAEELETQAKALKQLGEELKKLGLRFGIHHHTPEMENNAREFHSNFQKTAPEIVGFCFDVHWIYRGGLAPMKALEDYGNRVVSWHLRQSRNKIWWEDLDEGDVNYKEIARFANDRKLTPHYTIELALEPGMKITRAVVENHRRSRDFVKRVFEA
jgi:inosose dehydratase